MKTQKQNPTRVTPISRSDFIFLYETIFNNPNGDPFQSGDPRIDKNHGLVSGVRVKRFGRDCILERGLLDTFLGKNPEHEIYVTDINMDDENGTGSEIRMNQLEKKYKEKDPVKLLCKCIDSRVFGAISSKKGMAAHLTGPFQLDMLNPTINEVTVINNQNTSSFKSKAQNTQGAMAMNKVIAYGLQQIKGHIKPYTALVTGMSVEDLETMMDAIWVGTQTANTRSKTGQSSLLMLNIKYDNLEYKFSGLRNLIKINSNIMETDIRSRNDFNFDFSELNKLIQKKIVTEVQYRVDDLLENDFLNQVQSPKLVQF